MGDCYPPPSGDGTCNNYSTYQYLHSSVDGADNNVFTFDSRSGPHLIVSNSPETIGGSGLSVSSWINLYKAHIPIPAGTTTFRVFFWHVNDYTSGDTQFNLYVSIPGGGSISSRKRKLYNGAYKDILSRGMCLAEKQLYAELDTVSGTLTVPSSGEVALWAAVTAEDKQSDKFSLVACVEEFTVSVSEATYLNFRSVVSRDGTWGDWGTYDGGSDNVATVGAAPRGWWPYSKLVMTHETEFNCALIGSHPVWTQLSICYDEGVEISSDGFAVQTGTNPDSTPADKYGKRNKGAYGANLEYKLRATATGNSGRLYIGLLGYETMKFAGAGRIISPDTLPKLCVPKFRCEEDGEADGHRNCLDLLQQKSPKYYSIGVGEHFEARLDFAVGGAATTPVNVLLAREGLWAVPAQGGS